ncbi:hypothetical protein V5O48_003664 [Marasmius crinis-equi]|uniref:Phosphoglycerate mutase-like protein n=1 Tax=Marasmius crinis-equi TaxID=585013 RepID=A0ABR3FSB2_9AGAR
MAFQTLLLIGLISSSLAATSKAPEFNPLHHSGPSSPYFNAPSQSDVPVEIPDGCVVDQAAYIARHGSRYPLSDVFTNWNNLFSKFQNATYKARGPLSFIPSWVPPVDDQGHELSFLSTTGASETFNLGVDLRKRYGFTKGGSNFTVWAASSQRDVDSATYFLRGYLSQGNYLSDPTLNRGNVISLVDSSSGSPYADSLTPFASCPAFAPFDLSGINISESFAATYQTGVAQRLNTLLDGLHLNQTDISVMQDLCGFAFEIDGDNRFCDVFEESEWLDFEYAYDLLYYYSVGPGNPIAAATGYPWVKAVSDLFAVGPGKTVGNGTLVPPPLIMAFTHDTNLPPIIAALGLWNSSTTPDHEEETIYPLPVDRRVDDPRRMFRSSYLVPYLGNIALERMSCDVGGPTTAEQQRLGVLHQANVLGGTVEGAKTGSTEVFVRIRADNAPILIPGCASGPGSTCPLEQFLEYVNGPRKDASGDFVEKCGLVGVEGATSDVKFLTTSGDGESILVGM